MDVEDIGSRRTIEPEEFVEVSESMRTSSRRGESPPYSSSKRSGKYRAQTSGNNREQSREKRRHKKEERKHGDYPRKNVERQKRSFGSAKRRAKTTHGNRTKPAGRKKKRCHYGKRCTRKNCWFSHPGDDQYEERPSERKKGPGQKECWNGADCTRRRCRFKHPKRSDRHRSPEFRTPSKNARKIQIFVTTADSRQVSFNAPETTTVEDLIRKYHPSNGGRSHEQFYVIHQNKLVKHH